MKKAFSRKNLWEMTPACLKGVLGHVMSALPLPWLLGRRYRQWRRFLEEAQWWDSEQCRAYQFKRLKDIITLAYESTEFYRESFDDVGFEPGDFKELKDLSGLPMIDKAIIRENLDRMLTSPPAKSGVDYVTTSGTTGNPLPFYMDSSRHGVEFAHLSLSWGRVGYRLGSPMAVMRGTPLELDRTGIHHRYDPLLRHHVYSSFHLTAEEMHKCVAHMHAVHPGFLHAYPSSAYILCRFMAAEGLEFPESLRAILFESETMYEHQKEFIQSHFPVKLFSSYGHTEKLMFAAQCESSSLYHVWPTYGYCEVLETDGKPVEVGCRGEMIGTGFINRIVPFIRYRTADYAVLAGHGCPDCGRKHMLLDDICGHRSQEFLVTKDRRVIIAYIILNTHDDTFDGIIKFQFLQTVPGKAELRLVAAPGDPTYDLGRIRRHIEGKVGGQIDIALKLCDDIPPLKSGKKPVVLQEIEGVEEIDHDLEVYGIDLQP